MELKTLKDLHHIRMSPTRSGGKTTFDVNEYLLRAAAVKWYLYVTQMPSFNEISVDLAIAEFIKHFFNLTEDDLK